MCCYYCNARRAKVKREISDAWKVVFATTTALHKAFACGDDAKVAELKKKFADALIRKDEALALECEVRKLASACKEGLVSHIRI